MKRDAYMKVKYIQQYDEKDCGPTCLAMISQYYGKKVSIPKLREYSKTDKLGTTIYGLVEAGNKIDLDLTGAEANSLNELNDVNFPLIAHVINQNGLDHFLIIEKIKQNTIYIVDPAKGKYKLSKKEFVDIWTNIIILCNKKSSFTTNNNAPSYLNIYISILKSSYISIMIIAIFSFIINIVGIISAIYLKILTDHIIPSNLYKNLHIISLIILAIYFLNSVIDFFRYHLILKLSLKIDANLMKKYFHHVLHLPSYFFDTRKSGEILQRFMDTSKIREVLSSSTVTLLVDTVMVVIGGILLYFQSPLLLSVTALFIPFFILCSLFLKRPFESFNQKVAENNANLSSYLIESFDGSNTIKSYNAEEEHYKKGSLKFDKFMKNLFKLGIFSNIQLTINNLLKLLVTLVILWLGSYLVMTKQITLGSLLTFNSLIIFYIDPIERLINIQPTLQASLVASRRIAEILDLDREYELGYRPLKYSFNHKIVFNNVSYQYGFRNYALDKISFTIFKGQKIAIVGESGSGKSTIGKLLAGFYQANSGNIEMDEKNINNISLDSLRKNIGYVTQETFLLSDTIKNNLLYGSNKEYTEADMISACKKAEILDFILNLPEKFDTVIEKNGSNLSGGQAQRLSLARVFLKNPQIYILDESTSALDNYTENAIMKNINALKKKGKTIIIITHKLPIIRDSDNIYLLNDKKIEEYGNHKMLIENKGLYYSLWNLH